MIFPGGLAAQGKSDVPLKTDPARESGFARFIIYASKIFHDDDVVWTFQAVVFNLNIKRI